MIGTDTLSLNPSKSDLDLKKGVLLIGEEYWSETNDIWGLIG
jgi:hypothetical protein